MPIVESSAVERVTWEAGSRTLDICYKRGRRYRYFGVPASVYRELLTAPSIGAFVNDEIKGSYRFERL